LSIASGDIRNSPARLLANRLLSRIEQRQQTRQRLAIKDRLRLRVVASHDIAHSPQRRLHNVQRAMHKQLHKAKAHARVDDLLDLLVGAVAQIGDCPAGVS